ncbi:hypothetical protein [Aeromonas veronii]|uniref:hypothetical protein n=1 Tax=Aeromonas veronii TaxID=654 RepID=UPI003BF5BD0C
MPARDMQISLHQAVINAVMTKKPLIIVEGKDDLSIYHDLLNSNARNFNIKPIECFKDCSPGCKEIEDQVSEINKKYDSGHKIYSFFRGIVDRDAKKFRNELHNKNGLIYLRSYSFENSFVTRKSILSTVKLLTSVSNEQLTLKITDKMLEQINNQFIDFYYICLEAFKNAVVNDYEGLVGFSQGYERLLHDKEMKKSLELRKPDLDLFARENGITSDCIINMKDYCKGKWHLKYFLSSIQNFINVLQDCCGKQIPICPYCEVNNYDRCLYKPSINMNIDHVIKAIKNNIENADLDYLREELLELA